MKVLFFLRQLNNREMERKCCRRPGLWFTTMYTFLLGAVFVGLSSSRILLVKYSANEGKLICRIHMELLRVVSCLLVKNGDDNTLRNTCITCIV